MVTQFLGMRPAQGLIFQLALFTFSPLSTVGVTVVVSVCHVCEMVTIQVICMIFSFSSESGLELLDCCGLNHVLRQLVPSIHNTGAKECVLSLCLPLYAEFLVVTSCSSDF